MKKTPDKKTIQEIQQRVQNGESLWRIIDEYQLSRDEKIEILRLLDDHRWD